MDKDNRWKILYWFCFGLFAGTAFCMKWMEDDLWVNNEKFTIIGLEISYSREKTMTILSGLDEKVKTLLRYHLSFDFAFMAGVYPGIAALCMMGRKKLGGRLTRSILFSLALLQTVAWGCDITENIFLFNWIKHPVIGNEFGSYHLVVIVKWIIALTGALAGIGLLFKKRRDNTR
ncbi:MAG: hypothetical protein ABIR30_13235 [Chitinophagaceae bacterium]